MALGPSARSPVSAQCFTCNLRGRGFRGDFWGSLHGRREQALVLGRRLAPASRLSRLGGPDRSGRPLRPIAIFGCQVTLEGTGTHHGPGSQNRRSTRGTDAAAGKLSDVPLGPSRPPARSRKNRLAGTAGRCPAPNGPRLPPAAPMAKPSGAIRLCGISIASRGRSRRRRAHRQFPGARRGQEPDATATVKLWLTRVRQDRSTGAPSSVTPGASRQVAAPLTSTRTGRSPTGRRCIASWAG